MSPSSPSPLFSSHFLSLSLTPPPIPIFHFSSPNLLISIFFFFPSILLLLFPNCRPTALSWPFDSKWMYVGTDSGNIHMVNVENFVISGYCIYWSDAIDR